MNNNIIIYKKKCNDKTRFLDIIVYILYYTHYCIECLNEIIK